jgi:xanthosine utilization system XapX-like protein
VSEYAGIIAYLLGLANGLLVGFAAGLLWPSLREPEPPKGGD